MKNSMQRLLEAALYLGVFVGAIILAFFISAQFVSKGYSQGTPSPAQPQTQQPPHSPPPTDAGAAATRTNEPMPVPATGGEVQAPTNVEIPAELLDMKDAPPEGAVSAPAPPQGAPTKPGAAPAPTPGPGTESGDSTGAEAPVEGLPAIETPNTMPGMPKANSGFTPAFETFGTDGYVYDPTGRRDPFVPYTGIHSVPGPKGGAPIVTELEPLQRYELDQIKVIGIIWNVKFPRAMVVDPAGKVHVIKKMQKMGRNNGYVAVIREGEVVVVENFEDQGKITRNTKVLPLKSTK